MTHLQLESVHKSLSQFLPSGCTARILRLCQPFASSSLSLIDPTHFEQILTQFLMTISLTEAQRKSAPTLNSIQMLRKA